MRMGPINRSPAGGGGVAVMLCEPNGICARFWPGGRRVCQRAARGGGEGHDAGRRSRARAVASLTAGESAVDELDLMDEGNGGLPPRWDGGGLRWGPRQARIWLPFLIPRPDG